MSEKKDWSAMFDSADEDKNGFLTIQELAHVLRKHDSKLSDRQICDIFIKLDGADSARAVCALMANPDEKINKEKFVAGMESHRQFCENAEKIFHMYDNDNSGFLEKAEVVALIKNASNGKKTDKEALDYANDLMAKDDANHDGKISKEELMNALQ